MQNRGTVMLAFALGVMIGVNWPKLKKYVMPMTESVGKKSAGAYNEVLKLMVEQKERAEDLIAGAKIKKVAKKKEKAKKTKKRTAPKRKMTAASRTVPEKTAYI